MMLRRHFLNLLLLAPLAKAATAAGLVRQEPRFEPLNVKYTKIMGTMEITPEVMEAIRPRDTAFREETQRLLKEHFGRPMIEAMRMESELLEAFTTSGR